MNNRRQWLIKGSNRLVDELTFRFIEGIEVGFGAMWLLFAGGIGHFHDTAQVPEGAQAGHLGFVELGPAIADDADDVGLPRDPFRVAM